MDVDRADLIIDGGPTGQLWLADWPGPLGVHIRQADRTVLIAAGFFDQPPNYVQVNGKLITIYGANRTVTYRRGKFHSGFDAYACYRVSRLYVAWTGVCQGGSRQARRVVNHRPLWLLLRR